MEEEYTIKISQGEYCGICDEVAEKDHVHNITIREGFFRGEKWVEVDNIGGETCRGSFKEVTLGPFFGRPDEGDLYCTIGWWIFLYNTEDRDGFGAYQHYLLIKITTNKSQQWILKKI